MTNRDNGREWLAQLPIAHRGLYDQQSPENSADAIDRAAEHGYAVELDAQLSNDNTLVVFHDVGMERMTGHKDKVTKLSSEHIVNYDILGTRHRIATLREVLSRVDGKVPLLISIKGWSRWRKVTAALSDELRNYPGLVAVSTVSPLTYWELRRRDLDAAVGLVTSSMASRGAILRMIASVYRYVLQVPMILKPDFISIDSRSASNRFINRMRRKGCSVIVWTVRDKRELDHIRSLGANAMFELSPSLTESDLQPVF